MVPGPDQGVPCRMGCRLADTVPEDRRGALPLPRVPCGGGAFDGLAVVPGHEARCWVPVLRAGVPVPLQLAGAWVPVTCSQWGACSAPRCLLHPSHGHGALGPRSKGARPSFFRA